MKLTVRTHDINQPQLAVRFVKAQTIHRLSRVRHAIRRASVAVEDINGPKGGADIQVTIRLEPQGLPPIVVRRVGASVATATDDALTRARQALERALSRSRKLSRPAPQELRLWVDQLPA